MPVFIRPARVVIDDGGSPAAAIAAIIGLAVIVSSAAAIITDVLTAILIMLGVLAVTGTGVLVLLLRRSQLYAWRPAASGPHYQAAAPAAPAQAISAPRTLAIDPPTAHLTILTPEALRRELED